MKTPALATVVALLGTLFACSATLAAEDSLTTAVFSNVSNGYKRQKLPDGTFKREYFALSNGGYTQGIGLDHSIDDIPFSTIAVVAGRYLAKQNYYLAENSKSADLLLVISWGKTTPFNDGVVRNGMTGVFSAMNQLRLARGPSDVGMRAATASGGGRTADGIQSDSSAVINAAQDELEGQLMEMQMFNSMREKANEGNARLLGYMGEINARNNQTRFAGAGDAFNDLIEDIENERYYIIVAAYDFRAAAQKKERKLLWSTRISVQAQGNRFDEAMAAMMSTASRQFGQESGGLLRRYQTGYKIEYGELKVLGIAPNLASPEKPAEKK